MTDSFASTAAAVSSATGRPNVQWSLISVSAAIASPSVTSPRKLNVNGEISQIPYFDFGTDR